MQAVIRKLDSSGDTVLTIPNTAASEAQELIDRLKSEGRRVFKVDNNGNGEGPINNANELGPQNIHVAHLIIDAGVDTAWVRERIRAQRGEDALDSLPPDQLMKPESVANAYWHLYQQPRDAWSFEHEIRPYGEKW